MSADNEVHVYLSWWLYCLASLEPEYLISPSRLSNQATIEADILTFTEILTPEAASITSCFSYVREDGETFTHALHAPAAW